MVNVFQLLSRSVFAYNLKSVAYKPIPTSNGTSVNGSLSFNASQPFNGSAHEAAIVALSQSTKTRGKAAKSSGSASATSNPCDVVPYEAPPILDQTFPPYDQTTANVYRYRQQQSVNMGSWFVHEKWMTPSIFGCAVGSKTSEIDVANGWGSMENARAVLERHWDTFIDKSDFQYLASIGINTVRLPIGYWNLGPDFMKGTAFESVAQVYQNSWPRIIRAINQAGNFGVGVLVDLHGAVGSQNGQPHSGISDGQANLFSVPSNMDKTISVLSFLADQLASVNNVVGIQILNEPQATDALEAFYSRAIDAIRMTTPAAKSLPLYIHDAFDLQRFSSYLANRTDFVVQDHHSYFVFSPADSRESASQHTHDVKNSISKSLMAVSETQHRNLVVDEWSCTLTPESVKNEGNADQVRKTFCSDQMKVYANATAGWSFWSYKKEDCSSDPGWCFTAAVGNSLPNTFSDHSAGSLPAANNRASNVSDDNLILPIISTNFLDLLNTVAQQKRDGIRPHLPHRFEHIHYRRDADTTSTSGGMDTSITKGYTDGLTTAKIFASYNMSRLGFTGQFMIDAIKVAGSTLIATGTEKGYHGGFLQGLREGEKLAIS